MALILLGVVVLIIIGYVGYQLFLFSKVSKFLPAEGTVVSVVERGLVVPYMMKGNALVAQPPNVRPDGSIVFEEKDSPLVDGEKVALVSNPGVTGVALGIVHTDRTFTPLLTGVTNKADLLVTKEGIAVVSTHAFIDVEPSGEAPQKEGEPLNAPDEQGSATGPVSLPGVRYDLTKPEYELVAVNIKTGTITSLGDGRSPRLTQDGTVLALSHEGVVRINPASGKRAFVLERADADSMRGNISASANIIAVGSKRNVAVDLYRYVDGGVEYIGTLNWPTLIASLTFVDDTKFFIRSGTKVARLFTLPEQGFTAPLQVAVMKITQ